MGIVSVLAILLLTGAADLNPIGKYQMEAFSRGNITHIYVMDTTTGKVKWLDEMDTPFEEMKAN
jgi:hypothetical protein